MEDVIKTDKYQESVDKGSSHHSEGFFGLGCEYFQWAKEYPCHIKLEEIQSKWALHQLKQSQTSQKHKIPFIMMELGLVLLKYKVLKVQFTVWHSLKKGRRFAWNTQFSFLELVVITTVRMFDGELWCEEN